MDDKWNKVNGFPKYSVSSSGNVRNDSTGRMKELFVDTKGYLSVDLYSHGERKRFRVSRLVGEAFIDNPESKPQINHIDGNKLNNSVSNLEWVTAQENVRHAFDNGLCHPSRSMLGRKNPNAGRHGKKVRIVETGEVFDSILECERAINGNNRHICDCLSGRQKTHRGLHFEYV